MSSFQLLVVHISQSPARATGPLSIPPDKGRLIPSLEEWHQVSLALRILAFWAGMKDSARLVMLIKSADDLENISVTDINDQKGLVRGDEEKFDVFVSILNQT